LSHLQFKNSLMTAPRSGADRSGSDPADPAKELAKTEIQLAKLQARIETLRTM
jgi:hypothetical protein